MAHTLFQETVETGLQTMGATSTMRSGYEWRLETAAGPLLLSVWPDAVIGLFLDKVQALPVMQDVPNFGKSSGKFNFYYFAPSCMEAAQVLGVIKNIKCL